MLGPPVNGAPRRAAGWGGAPSVPTTDRRRAAARGQPGSPVGGADVTPHRAWWAVAAEIKRLRWPSGGAERTAGPGGVRWPQRPPRARHKTGHGRCSRWWGACATSWLGRSGSGRARGESPAGAVAALGGVALLAGAALSAGLLRPRPAPAATETAPATEVAAASCPRRAWAPATARSPPPLRRTRRGRPRRGCAPRWGARPTVVQEVGRLTPAQRLVCRPAPGRPWPRAPPRDGGARPGTAPGGTTTLEEVAAPRPGSRTFRLRSASPRDGGGTRAGAAVVALRGAYAVRVDALGVEPPGTRSRPRSPTSSTWPARAGRDADPPAARDRVRPGGTGAASGRRPARPATRSAGLRWGSGGTFDRRVDPEEEANRARDGKAAGSSPRVAPMALRMPISRGHCHVNCPMPPFGGEWVGFWARALARLIWKPWIPRRAVSASPRLT